MSFPRDTLRPQARHVAGTDATRSEHGRDTLRGNTKKAVPAGRGREHRFPLNRYFTGLPVSVMCQKGSW